MDKKRLPDLPDTGRRYIEHTVRARLASPGIEHYTPRRGGVGGVVFVVAIGVALLVVMWLLS